MPHQANCRGCGTHIPSSCSLPVACQHQQNPSIIVPCRHTHTPTCCGQSSSDTCVSGCDSRPAPACCKKSYLLPRIIASGHEWLRRCQAQLCTQLSDDCVEGPYSLISVTALCDRCSWQIIPQPSPRRLLLRVEIPLQCQLRDRCGHLHDAASAISTDVCLFSQNSCMLNWQQQIKIVPNVRLTSLPCASRDLCFDVQLEVLVEAYMLRWEPYMPGKQPGRECTELPLYPELHNE